MEPDKFSRSEIIKISVNYIREVQRIIENTIFFDPESAFETVLLGRRRKPICAVDLHAERTCQYRLFRKFGEDIAVFGEENLRNETLNLTNEQRLVALLDMVDGTDLLKRGLSNWCSAMIFFYPNQAKILAAFVGFPSSDVYYAVENHGVYKQPLGRKQPPLPIKGPSSVSNLEDASICFYGQKIKNLLPIVDNQSFINCLKDMREKEITTKVEAKLRFYNLAGNPMMVRLADGVIDGIFEMEGQYPHDVAPGAYIAQQAGGIFKTLDDKPIDLLPALLRPADPEYRLRYILTSTPQLYQELRGCLGAI